MNRELLKQTLDAQQFAIKDLKLRAAMTDEPDVLNISHGAYLKMENSINEIKAELEKPEPEPIAIVGSAYHLLWTGKVHMSEGLKIGDKLYADPPSRKPLSKDEIAGLWGEDISGRTVTVQNFARAIERSHRIGEQA